MAIKGRLEKGDNKRKKRKGGNQGWVTEIKRQDWKKKKGEKKKLEIKPEKGKKRLRKKRRKDREKAKNRRKRKQERVKEIKTDDLKKKKM